MRFGLVLALLLVVPAGVAEEVERVLALVNGVPILASDVELASIAQLVPRLPQEEEEAYRRAVVEALVALELRYQDLAEARISQRVAYDWQRAWQKAVEQAGGPQALEEKLAQAGLSQGDLARLVRRAALVEAYVAKRFAAAVRVSQAELQAFYVQEFLPSWPPHQGPPPPLEQVRGPLEAALKERKLTQEVQRWTQELAQRGEVIRYFR
ncbi:MAG: hypothetical protein RMI39_00985 [Thermoanaerobaculum sp.]|nr:hypothetical protein [Thermoanaerobaculum sp.]